MTCAVAIRFGGKIFIGTDTLVSNGHHADITDSPKAFLNKGVAMAYAGNCRLGQILRYNFIPPEISNERFIRKVPLAYMVECFIPVLRATLDDENYLSEFTDENSCDQILVVFDNKIFTVFSDFSVHESTCRYAAIGSGMDLALGAIHGIMAYRKNHIEDAQDFVENDTLTGGDLVELAVQAAQNHLVNVGGTVDVLTVVTAS